MSLGQESFQAELESILREAGLPTEPHKIVGRLYRFGCEHGSHHHILTGTVHAIEISDEGGFDLYVSNPRFWGERLISIKHSNGKWMAHVEIVLRGFFEGEFQLL